MNQSPTWVDEEKLVVNSACFVFWHISNGDIASQNQTPEIDGFILANSLELYYIDGNTIHSHDYKNIISIWLKAFWIEHVWTFNVRTIVGRFPRASLGLADSFCCSTLDRKENFWTDQQRFSEIGESHVISFDDDDDDDDDEYCWWWWWWVLLMMMMMSIADEYCWLNVHLIGQQCSYFSSWCVWVVTAPFSRATWESFMLLLNTHKWYYWVPWDDDVWWSLIAGYHC